MVDVHIETHADGIGRDQIIDLAGLIHGHLGVARTWAERAQHHGAAAALAAHLLGHGVDRRGGKRDDGRAWRQAAQFARSGVAQLGKARADHKLRVGNEAPEQGADGRRAKQHGLDPAPRVEKPIGKDVAALAVGGKLDLVDGDKIHGAIKRHGLDGADEIARVGRDAFFLAGHEGHGPAAFLRDDPVVDLSGEQAQGKADHARAVTEHALHGEMGFAGVGGAENGGNAAPLARERCHGVRIARDGA